MGATLLGRESNGVLVSNGEQERIKMLFSVRETTAFKLS